MKDLYSFSKDVKEHEVYYEKVKQAYVTIFNRLGLGDKTYITFASGGMFSKFSHEFQTLTEAGEDVIYIHEGKKIAINKEVLNDEVLADLGISKSDLKEAKAVEVGNIFSLGTRFSDALELKYKDAEGKSNSVVMGSYGIGPGRVMGTIAEILSDDKGLVWPETIAPFAVHLVALYDKEGEVKKIADQMYEHFTKKGIEVLYDDRDATAGEKFSDSDLIGLPKRIVISAKTLKEASVEVKMRKSGEVSMVKIDSL
jgi:prolyl-tRNA synthetase